MTAFVILIGAVLVLTGWSGLPPKLFNWAITYAASGPYLARNGAVVIGLALIIGAIYFSLRWCLVGWHSMWSIRLHPRYKYPHLVRRDGLPFRWFIPLPEAAEIAREQTADSHLARIAREVCNGGQVTLLSYYAGLLCDADWITLYGCRRNSGRLERISPAEFKSTHFVDDGASLMRRSEPEPIYTSVHMCRLELKRRIRQLVTADGR